MNMDIDRQNLIIPATTTRKLQLAGGQPMEQAVPEEYVTAAMTLRAMEKREGRSLEFILKGYLPVAIISSYLPDRFFLVELLGLTSESILKPHKAALHKILEKVKKASTSEEMTKCIQTARYEINLLLESTNSTIVGLFAGLIARGITQLLDRPSGQTTEDYAITLTGIIDSSEFDKSIHELKEATEILNFIETALPDFLEVTIPKIDALINTHRAESQPLLSRLDLEYSLWNYRLNL
jgi:hypothetical protein